MLHAHQIDIADAFSGRTPGPDRFLCGEWASDDDDLPFLIPAQANIFCDTDAISSYGTHSIVIGKVHHVAVRGQVAPLLYGLEPGDPVTLIAAVSVLGAVAAVAMWIPASRATRTDPAQVLRVS